MRTTDGRVNQRVVAKEAEPRMTIHTVRFTLIKAKNTHYDSIQSSSITMEVWYQLRFDGEEPQGDVDAVYLKASGKIINLRDAIKTKWGIHLHCPPPLLKVFAADADPNNDEHLDPGDSVPEGTTSKKPLIVVAPQQDGELRCCSRIVESLCILWCDSFNNLIPRGKAIAKSSVSAGRTSIRV